MRRCCQESQETSETYSSDSIDQERLKGYYSRTYRAEARAQVNLPSERQRVDAVPLSHLRRKQMMPPPGEAAGKAVPSSIRDTRQAEIGTSFELSKEKFMLKRNPVSHLP